MMSPAHTRKTPAKRERLHTGDQTRRHQYTDPASIDNPTIRRQPPAFNPFSHYIMEHYYIVETLQLCGMCGGTQKLGHMSTEIFVQCSQPAPTRDNPDHRTPRSLPVREVIARYAAIFDVSKDEAAKYLPNIPRKIHTTTLDIPMCAQCFVGDYPLGEYSSHDPKYQIPPALPVADFHGNLFVGKKPPTKKTLASMTAAQKAWREKQKTKSLSAAVKRTPAAATLNDLRNLLKGD